MNKIHLKSKELKKMLPNMMPAWLVDAAAEQAKRNKMNRNEFVKQAILFNLDDDILTKYQPI
jgi:hypothetical protein